MADKKTCKCGTETNVKKDGNLWKHQTPDGVACDLSQSHDNGGLLPEGPTVAVNDTPEPERVEVPEVKTPAPVDSGSVFSFEIKVYASNTAQHDDGWHVANQVLVSKKAEQAGHIVTGKPKLVSNETDGRKVAYRYDVPVKE